MPFRVLHPCARNLMKEGKPGWKKHFVDFTPSEAFEKMQNSKLTPKGFEVIYVSPLHNILKFNYSFLPLFWGVLCFDTYTFLTSEDYIGRLQKYFKNASFKEKIFQLGLITSTILLIHVAQSRVVVAIFRKGNEFQTLLYGFLGPLTKTYVPHGFQAMKATAHKIIYDFNGKKKVVVLSNGFQSLHNFQSVIKL